MKDTEKYEGHTPADEWERHLIDVLSETEFPMTYADNQLMTDAPKLLDKVKDLRSTIDYIREVGKMDRNPSGYLLSIMEKVLTTEEYLEWRNEE